MCYIPILKSFRFGFTLRWHEMGRTREMGSGFCMEGIMMILVNGAVNARESVFSMEKEE